jgi:uncharacterized membrane protein
MNKNRSLLFFLASLMVMFLFGESCVSHDFPSYTCDGDVNYADDVHTIVMTKCAISPCHGTDPDLPDWSDFTTFQDHAAEVKRRVVERIMPPDDSPNGALTQEEINAIACWVDQGAQNN